METQKINYTLAETESTLSQTADDRSVWRMYTADPVMIRKMEAIGAKLLREYDDYQGRLYEVKAEQVSFKKGKRQLSEETRAKLTERIRKVRPVPVHRDENDEISTKGASGV